MIYTEKDICDLKCNLNHYSGIQYLGDVEAEKGEIFTYWKPTIGLYRGFEQIKIKGEFSNVARQASKLLWGRINKFFDGDYEFLVSVNSFDKWMNIKVESGADIVDAFELYEEFSEFVAVEKQNRFLIAVHSENVSIYSDELFLYFFKIDINEDGAMSFLKCE